MKRKILTKSQLEKAFELGDKIRSSGFDLESSINKLVEIGVDKSTARGILKYFECLMNGETYTSNSGALVDEVYLKKIYENYSLEILRVALESMKNNIINSKRTAKKRWEIYHYYFDQLDRN